jgi:hypothetical protein
LYEKGDVGCSPSPHLSPSKLPVLPEKEIAYMLFAHTFAEFHRFAYNEAAKKAIK